MTDVDQILPSLDKRVTTVYQNLKTWSNYVGHHLVKFGQHLVGFSRLWRILVKHANLLTILVFLDPSISYFRMFLES